MATASLRSQICVAAPPLFSDCYYEALCICPAASNSSASSGAGNQKPINTQSIANICIYTERVVYIYIYISQFRIFNTYVCIYIYIYQ